MKTKLLLAICLMTSIEPCLSQKNIGPRLVAMGYTGAAIPDIWSVNANPATITEFNTTTAAANYQKPFVDATISNQAAGLICPLIKSAIGLYFCRYGIEEFNEIQASAMIAKKFGGLFSFALRGNYHQIRITDYGTTSAFSLDVGMAFFPSPEVKVGFYLDNLTFEKYHHLSVPSKIQTKFHGGIAYTFSDRITIGSNINFESLSLAQTLGIEYKISPVLIMRGGLSTKPLNKFIGFGINLQHTIIDIAVERTVFLTYTPQIGISYVF